jgi:transcriptional regulator with XRE-family HTH domain
MNEKIPEISKLPDSDDIVFIFCDRLRQLRKRLNLNIEDLSEKTGLSFGQIQRLEGRLVRKNNAIYKRGAEGRANTLIILLMYYSQRISLDLLVNFKMSVSEIKLDKVIGKDIAREKILSLIKSMREIAEYIE